MISDRNTIPKRVLYMNLGTTRLRGRPRNRWQNEVREDGRIGGGEGWQENVHNREMEEAPENGKELSHSAYAKGTNECIFYSVMVCCNKTFSHIVTPRYVRYCVLTNFLLCTAKSKNNSTL